MCKISENLLKELLKKDGIEPFKPMSRKMREWMQINRKKSEDYLKDKKILR